MEIDTKSIIAGTIYAGINLNPTKDIVLNDGDINVDYDATGVD